MRFRRKYKFDGVQEKLFQNIENQLRERSFSYEKLGKTLKKMPEFQWKLSEEEIYQMLGRISLDTCQDCEEYYRCYRQDKEKFLVEAKRVFFYLEQQGTGRKERFMEKFHWNCQRKRRFIDALIQSYEILVLHKNWKNKMLCQRKIMATQMEAVSRVLFECSLRMEYEKKRDSALTGKVRKRLREEKILLERMEFLESFGKKKELFLIVKKKGKGMRVDSLAKILEEILEIPLVPTRECPVMLYGETTLLHFKEDVAFQVLSGVAHRTKDGERESGDLYSILRLEEGKQICMLTDGMGSGREARAESRQMMELMEQLLTTGFREEETVKLVNAVVTFGWEPSRYASVDMLSVNLQTGLMKIMKSGSAATFLLRDNGVEILQSNTLPAGFLWETEFDVIYKKLYDGDRIVLVSDGILERHLYDASREEIKKFFSLAREGNSQQAAERILESVLERGGNRAEDDMTVLVLSVWKKRMRM